MITRAGKHVRQAEGLETWAQPCKSKSPDPHIVTIMIIATIIITTIIVITTIISYSMFPQKPYSHH